MSAYTERQIEEIMENVLEGLESDKFDEDGSYYDSLYPEAEDEGVLTKGIISYPKLIGKGKDIVEKIIHLISEGYAYSIWINDEVQAGSYLAYVLAINDKQYCELFARLLAVQDLDHEVNQNDDIKSLLKKWGVCPETILIIDARINNPGQWGNVFFNELLESGALKGTKYVIDENTKSDEITIAKRFSEDLVEELNVKLDRYIQEYIEKSKGQQTERIMRLHIYISNATDLDVEWLKNRFQKIRISIKPNGRSEISVDDEFELESTSAFLAKACNRKIVDGIVSKALSQWLIGEFENMQSKGLFKEEIECYLDILMHYQKEKNVCTQFYVYNEDGNIKSKRFA